MLENVGSSSQSALEKKERIGMTFSIDAGVVRDKLGNVSLCVYEINGHNSGHLSYDGTQDRDTEGVHTAHDLFQERRLQLQEELANLSNNLPQGLYFSLEKIIKDPNHFGYIDWREKNKDRLGDKLESINNLFYNFISVPIFKEANSNPPEFELVTRDKIAFERSGIIPTYAKLPTRNGNDKYPEDKEWVVKPRYGFQSRGVKVLKEGYIIRRLARDSNYLNDYLVQEYNPGEEKLRILVDATVVSGSIAKVDFKFILGHTNITLFSRLKRKLLGSVSNLVDIHRATYKLEQLGTILANDILKNAVTRYVKNKPV